MTQDAVPRLRPMTFTDLIDATVSLYRRNFALFAGVVAVLAVPEAIINTLLTISTVSSPITTSKANGSTNFHFNPVFPVAAGATAVIGFLFGIVITGALAQAISARYLGEPMTVGRAYGSVGVGRFAALAAASVLSGIVIALPVIVAAGIFVLLLVAHAPVIAIVLAAIVLFVAGAVLAICIWVRLQFIPQAIVIERLSIGGGFRRSWALVSGSAWRVFGIVLLISLIVGGIEGVVGLVFAGVLSVFSHPAATLVSSLVDTLILPAQFGAFTLLYYDLRVRKEGFDLEHLANHLAVNPA
ncbi:MAG TPA: hypothetical protein VFB34_01510 [Chloroflexota bacterium]|nr:hypothetical protein [Chloroflexota bacterium]